jgi:Fur family ferric uptake transcriptional regulator
MDPLLEPEVELVNRSFSGSPTHREVARSLRSVGLKITAQRILILSTLRNAAGHSTVTSVLERVRSNDLAVDASTVYRTLTAAEDAGLVTRFEQVGRETAYEWLGQAHHHLVCSRCGGVTSLTAEMLAPVKSLLLDVTGFVADLRHIAISGTCRDCARKPTLDGSC